jgi:hypothetical protein
MALGQITLAHLTDIPQGWGYVKAKNGSVLDGTTPFALISPPWSQNAREARGLAPEKKQPDSHTPAEKRPRRYWRLSYIIQVHNDTRRSLEASLPLQI